jgi:hypothetical protein
LRLFGSFVEPVPTRPANLSDRELPVYTVIVALYRETESVSALVASLRKLDYPGLMAQAPQAIPLPKGHILQVGRLTCRSARHVGAARGSPSCCHFRIRGP